MNNTKAKNRQAEWIKKVMVSVQWPGYRDSSSGIFCRLKN